MEARGEGDDDAPAGESFVIAGRWRTAPITTAAHVPSAPHLPTPAAFAPPPTRRGRAMALTATLAVVALGWAGAVVTGQAPDPSSALWPVPSARPGTPAPVASASVASASVAPSSDGTSTGTASAGASASPDPEPSGPLAGYPITGVTPPRAVAPPRWPSLKGPRGHLSFSVIETAELSHDDAPENGGLRAYLVQDFALSAATVKRGRTLTVRIFEQSQVPVVDYLPSGRLECLGGTPLEPKQKPYGWQVGAVQRARNTAVFGFYPVTGDALERLSAAATAVAKAPTIRATDYRMSHSPDNCYALSQLSVSLTVRVPGDLAPGTYRLGPEAPLKVNRVWTTTSDGTIVDLSPATADPRITGSLPTVTVTA